MTATDCPNTNRNQQQLQPKERLLQHARLCRFIWPLLSWDLAPPVIITNCDLDTPTWTPHGRQTDSTTNAMMAVKHDTCPRKDCCNQQFWCPQRDKLSDSTDAPQHLICIILRTIAHICNLNRQQSAILTHRLYVVHSNFCYMPIQRKNDQSNGYKSGFAPSAHSFFYRTVGKPIGLLHSAWLSPQHLTMLHMLVQQFSLSFILQL